MVAQPVALLDDVDHRPLFLLRRLREQRLVHVRIEAALGLDLGETLALQQLVQVAMDEPDALETS